MTEQLVTFAFGFGVGFIVVWIVLALTARLSDPNSRRDG